MIQTPEIRIVFSYLLFDTEVQKLAGDGKLESYEQYEAWTEAYRTEWSKYESKILPALQKVLGLAFYKNVIDVNCAPYFIPKSDPLIMNFRSEPDEFVDVLTHELCHVLLTDNNRIQINGAKPKPNLLEKWQKMYDTEDFGVAVHVPVHALSKYVYLDVLKEPTRLERDINSMKKYEGGDAYVAAWDYVNDHSYAQIIDDLKKMYESI